MKTFKITTLFIAICTSLFFVGCSNDDDVPTSNDPDFSGNFVQQDIMGRPGINTVFSPDDATKNAFNVSAVSNRASFQPPFQAMLEAYHDVYGAALGTSLDFETNILGLDAATFTTVLAQFDALQVAADGQTIYFNPNTGLALTGRRLQDDVIDVSLTLMFGGMTGTRFDGNNGTPQLTSDGVGFGNRVVGAFPYMEKQL